MTIYHGRGADIWKNAFYLRPDIFVKFYCFCTELYSKTVNVCDRNLLSKPTLQ